MVKHGVETAGRTDGGASFAMTQEWARHFVSFKTRNDIGTNGNVQIMYRQNATGSVCMPKLELGVTMTPYRKSEYDLVGPAGSDGAMMIPQGKFVEGPKDSDIYAYQLATEVVNGKEVVTGRPLVYHAPNDDDQGQYFLLQNNIKGRDNTVANLNNTAYWRRVDKYEALYVKILMANYAKLASAVFHGDYMFSDLGVTPSGLLESHASHIGGDAPMFADGRLTGNFAPNLFLDFLTGLIKSNRFVEPFLQVPYDVDAEAPIYRLTTLSGCNVSVQPRQHPLLIAMPDGGVITSPTGEQFTSVEWEADGTNSTIIVQSSTEYINDRANGAIEWSNIADYAVVLCADGRFVDYRSYRHTTYDNLTFDPESTPSVYEQNRGTHFVVGGYTSRVLILLPGDIVKLKSCVTKTSQGDKTYWYVENHSDFLPVKANINLSTNKYIDDSGNVVDNGRTYESYDIGGNYTGNAVYGAAMAFGSSSLMSLAMRDVNLLNNKVDYYVTVDGKQVPVYTSTTPIKMVDDSIAPLELEFTLE